MAESVHLGGNTTGKNIKQATSKNWSSIFLTMVTAPCVSVNVLRSRKILRVETMNCWNALIVANDMR